MLHRDDRPSTSARSLELRELYEAFNAREIDRVLAAMTSDFQWPNGWEGGHLEGRASVRDYWIRQWAQLRLSFTPVQFRERGDGRIEVAVRLVARDPGGSVFAREEVRHVYEFEGRLVRRMQVEQ
ncbi:nuclear transport factor 2 family protein [Streptomyces sp. ADI98-10]|uniref:nuclear transport factor 2 family protein n=1 Tax=Streptomyces sp. ADI98-10 TaxID=1522763 RepID=UPI000FA83555|nr:nuclear transport factor 2 family protein [Streptomyces sp. ADI98-10]RPK81398.1 SnoaL-like domain protein [Streptomyces sp. ADI98-10]